jgi:hypothetical protein
MNSPAFLLLDEPEHGAPAWRVLTLDGGNDEAFLVVNAGPAFLLTAAVGDFVEVSRDQLIVRLGQEWPRPDPRAAQESWRQIHAGKKEPPP